MWPFKRAEFKIKFKSLGRCAEIEYSEGDQRVKIWLEMLAVGPSDWAANLRTLKAWDPPDDAVIISDDDRERIRSRVTAKLGRARIDWEMPFPSKL